ncbi:MAG: ABC transporter substrate-binding protein [Candidatus Thiodiazotropha sp.]
MKITVLLCQICLSCLLIGVAALKISKAETVTYTCNNFLPQFQRCDQFVSRWAEQTGNSVKVREKLWITDDELSFIQQILATHNTELDILMVDVIWTELLANYLIDLNDHVLPEQLNPFFEKILINNTDSRGRLVAMPLFSSVGMLFFRKDLLKKYGRSVPQTWEELTETATYIVAREKKINPHLVGFVWQGRQYEGLTCAALEWIDSYRGGTIVDGKGNITVNNPKAVKALQTAKGWIGKISPPEVLDFSEEEARVVFQKGNAVFMRSWPFIWPMANAHDSFVKGKIGAAPIPRGGEDGKHSGTLGGWNLAVSKWSSFPKEAVDLSRFMTSSKIQLERSIVSGVAPTATALYGKNELLESQPFLKEMPKWIDHAVARPSKITGVKYSKVSNKFSRAVHDVLSGKMGAADALIGLEKELTIIKGQGWSK